MQKGFCPKQGKSLKNYAIFRFSCKPRGTISSARKHVFEKVLQKRLNTKIFISDKPEFCGAIGAGLFAVDSDRLLERLECNALNINPKNLVILIGTNDIGIGVPTEYTLKNIKEILQRTQTLCSNTAVKAVFGHKASEHECSEVMADYINCQVFKGGDLSIWYQMKIIRVLRRILLIISLQ